MKMISAVLIALALPSMAAPVSAFDSKTFWELQIGSLAAERPQGHRNWGSRPGSRTFFAKLQHPDGKPSRPMVTILRPSLVA